MRDHGVDIFTLDGALLLSMDMDEESSYVLSSSVSTNPVDRGLPTASHIQPLPPTLSYTGIITQTPLWDDARFKNLDRLQVHKRIFDALHKAAQLVRIVDDLDVYEPYSFKEINISRSGELGQAMRVQLTFGYFNQVTEETTAVDPSIIAGLKRRTRKRKPPKPPNDKQKKASKEAAKNRYGDTAAAFGLGRNNQEVKGLVDTVKKLKIPGFN